MFRLLWPQKLRSTSLCRLSQRRRYSSQDCGGEAKFKTPLFRLHTQHGATFVPFGGYSMPLHYSDLSARDSHLWTRKNVSLFDVSHMVQHNITGPGATGFLSRLTPSSIKTMKPGYSTLTTLLHPETGGIVDDTIVSCLEPELFNIVTNASCREKDAQYLSEHVDAWNQNSLNNGNVVWEVVKDQALVALQGPLSPSILGSIIKFPSHPIFFGQCFYSRLLEPATPEDDVKLFVRRGGYTGEDGFEISLPSSHAESFVSLLFNTPWHDKIRLAGLAARDSLRLEAGMCLYGRDLDDTTTPPEASLAWLVGKDRRIEGGFFGAETVIRQLSSLKHERLSRLRVGLVIDEAPARQSAEIIEKESDQVVGIVTSGCPSPTLEKNIAMGYVKYGLHKQGTELDVLVRGKKRHAVITKMPFVAHRFCKPIAS